MDLTEQTSTWKLIPAFSCEVCFLVRPLAVRFEALLGTARAEAARVVVLSAD
jgi:hypothetical protein